MMTTTQQKAYRRNSELARVLDDLERGRDRLQDVYRAEESPSYQLAEALDALEIAINAITA